MKISNVPSWHKLLDLQIQYRNNEDVMKLLQLIQDMVLDIKGLEDKLHNTRCACGCDCDND